MSPLPQSQYDGALSKTGIDWSVADQLRVIANDVVVATISAANFAIESVAQLTVKGALSHVGSTLGFFNAAVVTQPSAYTQTYSTADKTLGAYAADDESAAYTGGAADSFTLAELNALRVAVENLRALAEDNAQITNSIIDDLQALGLVQ